MLKVNDDGTVEVNKCNKPVYIMLCGLPGAGKTTFRKNLIKNNPQYNFVTISTDDYIEEQIKDTNIKYKDYYDNLNLYKWRIIHERLKDATIKAVSNKRNIIVDSLNLTEKSRLKKTRFISTDYERIAVVFYINGDRFNTILKRNETRDIARDIPLSKMHDMYNYFEHPKKEDGFFNEIYLV